MIDRILNLFGAEAPAELERDDVPAAAAALMVEAALTDGSFDDDERAVIRRLLENRLNIPAGEADAVIAEAERRVDAAAGTWQFAQTIKNSLPEADRIDILEMIWEVIYADGVVHDLEASLARRVAGLLYVRDQDSGAARRRVRQRLGID